MSSLYDACSVWDFMKTVIEYLAKSIWMDLEGGGRGLIDVLSWYFVGRAGEIHGKSSGRIAYVHIKIRTGYFSHTRTHRPVQEFNESFIGDGPHCGIIHPVQ